MTRSSKNGFTLVEVTGLEPDLSTFLQVAYLCEKSKEVAYLCEKLKNLFSFFRNKNSLFLRISQQKYDTKYDTKKQKN